MKTLGLTFDDYSMQWRCFDIVTFALHTFCSVLLPRVKPPKLVTLVCYTVITLAAGVACRINTSRVLITI